MNVSVVVPTYNGARFIREALESVFAQTLLPKEIIVVDDASTDQTVEVVEEISKQSRVPLRIIELPHNSGGPARPINAGIDYAVCEFVALLDQDDVLMPDNLQIRQRVLNEHPSVVMVLSDFEHFEGDNTYSWNNAEHQGRHVFDRVCRNKGGISIAEADDCLSAFAECTGFPLSCSNQFFRRSLWESVGGFSEAAGLATDHDFLFRSIRGPIAWIDKVLFRKRVHSANAFSASKFDRFRADQRRANIHELAAMSLGWPPRLTNVVLAEQTGLCSSLRHLGRFRDAYYLCTHLLRHRFFGAAIRETIKTVLFQLLRGQPKSGHDSVERYVLH